MHHLAVKRTFRYNLRLFHLQFLPSPPASIVSPPVPSFSPTPPHKLLILAPPQNDVVMINAKDAPTSGYEAVVRLLIERDDVDINSKARE